jgi:hypothetical protein
MTCHAKLVGQDVSCSFSWFYAFWIPYLSIVTFVINEIFEWMQNESYYHPISNMVMEK